MFETWSASDLSYWILLRTCALGLPRLCFPLPRHGFYKKAVADVAVDVSSPSVLTREGEVCLVEEPEEIMQRWCGFAGIGVKQSREDQKRNHDVIALGKLVFQHFCHGVKGHFEVPVSFVSDEVHNGFFVGVCVFVEV